MGDLDERLGLTRGSGGRGAKPELGLEVDRKGRVEVQLEVLEMQELLEAVSVPDAGGCSPEMSFMSELLPQPEGPTTAMNSPCAMSSVTSSRARTAAAPRP